MLLFFCAFYATGIPSAHAIKHASPTEIDAIQKQIYLANKMDAKVKKADLDLHDAKASKANDGEIIKLEKMLAREKDKQSAARTKAIHMTILAYDLAPVSHRGTSVMPWTKDREIEWLPVARDIEARQIQNAEGALKNSGQPKKPVLGVAYPDGVVYIAPEAFEKGVGALASALFHERIHFEQMTTDGKGNMMSRAEGESEAYKAEKDNSAIFFDPTNADDRTEIAHIAAQYQEESATVAQEQEALKGLKGLLRRLRGRVDPPDIFESKVHTNAELADIKGLVAQAHAQAARARREQETRESTTQAESQRNHDERLRNRLINIAKRSCADPGSVSQTELDSLPAPYNKSSMDLKTGELSGFCDTVYLMLVRGTNAEALRRESTPTAMPVPAQPIQPSPYVPIIPKTPFSTVLPGLRNHAVYACSSSGEVPIDSDLTNPNHSFTFWKEMDDKAADKLAAGLGDCERRLFRELIRAIRDGYGNRISSGWVKEMVEEYRPRPIYSAPRRRESQESPQQSCPPCVEENGVRSCPAGC
ncbi:MAG: hypothetical protein ABL955_08335 [Elusimicrobiota bacterium]